MGLDPAGQAAEDHQSNCAGSDCPTPGANELLENAENKLLAGVMASMYSKHLTNLP